MPMLEYLFPDLYGTNYRITSPATDDYNCIAWASGVASAWWWAVSEPLDPAIQWPDGASRELTLSAFKAAFATLGFVPCDGEELESGVERGALFADHIGVPTHAARQLPNGNWTSKLGQSVDIEHPLRAVEGDIYGTVVQILKRPRAG
jgi:hypothetical protein